MRRGPYLGSTAAGLLVVLGTDLVIDLVIELVIELDHLAARPQLLLLLFVHKVISLRSRITDNDGDLLFKLWRHLDLLLRALGLDDVDKLLQIAHDLVFVRLQLLEARVNGV